MEQFGHLKSRRLDYYNYDEQRTKSRIFSALEIEQANSVFYTIENILSENDIELKEKWVSEGRCQCQTHQDTYFMIEVDSDILDASVIHDIEEALEELHVKLVVATCPS